MQVLERVRQTNRIEGLLRHAARHKYLKDDGLDGLSNGLLNVSPTLRRLDGT